MKEKQNNRSLTILIAALNEERLIELSVSEILTVASGTLDQYEIILFNDGSRDKTGKIMDQLATKNARIKVVHHTKPGGLGNVLQEGLAIAEFEKIILLTGDRTITMKGFERLLSGIGEADLIIGYRDNQMQTRLFFRLVVSYFFRLLMVALFRYDITDYHGSPIYPVEKLRELDIISKGYPVQVEILVKLLRRNVSYIEVPFSINKEKDGNSDVFRFKTFCDFFKMVWNLLRS